MRKFIVTVAVTVATFSSAWSAKAVIPLPNEVGYFQLGRWSPNPSFKGGTTFELSVEQSLATGKWIFTFDYQKGADALTIDNVELLVDGTVIAGDAHEGAAGSQHINNQYTLTVPDLKAGAKMSLRTKAHVTPWAGGGNGDTAGVITMAQPTTVQLYAPERPLPAIRATTPVAQDGQWWVARHQHVLDRNKSVRPDCVIIGDSITHCWGGEPQSDIEARGSASWKAAFANRAVTNLGFSGDSTQNVLWRIEHGELDGITPKQVIVLIGTNNLGLDTAEEVASGIDAVCRRIHEKLPAAQLFVLGILPRKDQPNLKADLDKVNFLLQTRLHPRPYVDVLDPGSLFRKPDGNFNDQLFSDHVHPNGNGYEVLGKALSGLPGRPLSPTAP